MKLGYSILAFCFLLSLASAQITPTQSLAGHVPPGVAGLGAVGHLEENRQLKVAIGLPLRNREALTNLLRRIYDPGDPQYHHYLSPRQFADMFGPTTNDYEAVKSFARAHGLAVAATHPNRMLLDVSGAVSDIEKAFHVSFQTYHHPNESRLFYAPDTEPSVAFGTPILHVGGLDNYTVPRSLLRKKSLQTAFGAPAPGTGSGPDGAFWGNDLRAAYAPGSSLTGAGQTIGLLEFDGYYAGDISAYARMAGVPLIRLTNVYLDGTDGTPGGNNSEVALDIDMAACMAPGLSSIVVYQGETGDDILNQMATDDSASELSSSWSYPIDAVTEQIFLQFAAQGQTMVNASGDFDAWVGDIEPPCDDPNITSVGGTTLTTSGAGGAWASETVWNWDVEYGELYNGSGGGGGISHAYAIPSWQAGINMATNQGSSALRNIPDVAMTADNVFIVADNGTLENVGGTSCAAALFAGFVALANEQAVARGRAPLGFLNPAIYDAGRGPNYTNLFHDVTTGNNTWSESPTFFFATPGYDLCTGWGTPAGTNLINLLAPDSLQISPVAGLAFGGGVGGPFLPLSQAYAVTNAGIASLDWAVGSDASWLDVTPTAGTLDAGAATAAIHLSVDPSAANLSLGPYGATVWFTNLTDGAVQSRFVTLAVILPPAISNQPLSVAQIEGTTAAFNVTVSGGLPLFFQWQLNGTNLANEGRISGAQNAVTNLIEGYVASDLFISNITEADGGSYTLVVSNAAGAVTSEVATLSLTASGPEIVQQPVATQTVLFGSTVQISVAVEGDQPIAYQWAQNGIPLTDGANLSGSTTPTLTINSALPTNVGNYTVVVTNDLGGATSAASELTVDVETNGVWVSADAAPIIVTQPATQTAVLGGSDVFTVVSAGKPPLSYQWEFNGSPIVAATNEALVLNDVPKTYAGIYSVLVSNSLGSSLSAGAQLSVFSGTPELITFDDLPTATTRVPEGYKGLSWSNFYYINAADTPLSGYNAGMVSTPNVAFNSNAEPAAITSTAPFSLLSADLTSAWNDGLQVEVKGYNASGLAYDKTYALSAVVPTLLNFSNIGVTSVQFIPFGGSFHLGYEGDGGSYFAMDNVEVSLTTNIASPLPLTTRYSFGGFDGGSPVSALARGIDGNFYGVTQYGGTNGEGTVFEITTNGVLTTLASLDRFNANPYGGLVQGADGKLYGVSQYGGTNNDGTVFSITTNGALRTVASFNLSVTGGNPETTLTLGPNGNLYGTSYFGGTNGEGCIFTVTTNGVLSALVSFDFANGAYPLDSLTLASDGNFYGTTLYGGPNDMGTVFRVTTYGALSTVFAFNSALTGAAPAGTLAQGSDGKLYGVTFYGGTNGMGTVFSITPEGAFSSLASFDYFVTGGNPETGLIFGSDGNLYGTACFGGAQNQGAIFSVTTNGTLTALASFGGTNGVTPQIGAALIEGSDGSFYGTTSFGGAAFNGSSGSGDGVIYRLGAPSPSVPTIIAQPSDQYALPGGLVNFNVKAGGAGPLSYSWLRNGVAISGASDSTYTTSAGKSGGEFRCVVSNLGGSVASSNAYLNIVDGSGPIFTFNGANGGTSYSALVEGAGGKLYGTTFYGGANSDGTVFSITPNGVLTTLVSFNYYSTGAYPYSGLVPAPDRRYYGTTAYGGRDGYGTVFAVTTNGNLTTLCSFNSYNGAYPYGGVTIGGDGALYGTTYQGGAFQGGTVFRLATNGALTTLASFDSTAGANPFTPLMKGPDGNLYGSSYYGGAYSLGTVFRVTTKGALTPLISFSQTNGSYPSGALTQGADGNLYGATSSGGTYNAGTLFRITTNGYLTTLASLDNTNGSNPRGSLVQGPDGNIYGAAYGGGLHGDGVAFSMTTNGLFAALFSFSGTNGSAPAGVALGPGGAFFGAASFGGAGYDGLFTSGNGAIFRIAPTYFSIGPSQAVTYGTGSVTLAGVVGALGSVHPAAGEPISVTINGVTQTTATSDASGHFSISFDLRGIPASETGYTVTYEYAGDSSLSPSINSTTTLAIMPLAVTLVGTRDYDGSTNAAASILVVSNIVGSDQVSVASGGAGLTGADAGTNAITSPGTLILGGPSAGNYTLSGANGAVVIHPLPVTLGGTRPYDGTAIVNASALNIQTNYDGANLGLAGNVSLQGSGAGAEGIVGFGGLTLSGSAAGNYTLNGASGAVTITPLALTITISNVSKNYGQAVNLRPTAFSVSGGLLGSEMVTSVNLVSAGTPATAAVSGSPYPITANGISGTGGFESGNYQITYNLGTLTVHHLRIVLTGKHNYDATTNAAAAALVVSNAVGSDQVSVASGRAGLARASVGTNAITSFGTLTLAGAAASNYTLIGAGGAVVIEPLPVTLSGTRPYDGTAQVEALLLNIETNYDGTNLGLSGSATLETNLAGAEPIADFSGLTLNGSAATNYTLAGASGAVTITPLALTITISNTSKTYGQAVNLNPSIFNVSGTLLGSERVTSVAMFSAGTAAPAPVSGSPYPITVTGVSGTGGFNAANYQITYNAGTLTVHHVKVVLAGKRNYDATTNATAAVLVVSNAVGADQVNLVSGRVGLAGADVGTNAITSLDTLALGGAAAGNYSLIGSSGAVLIAPLPVSLRGTRPYDGTIDVAASLLEIETNYDGTNLSLTGSAVLETNLVGAEGIADFSRLTLSGSAATNYTLEGATGTITVTPLVVTLIGTRDYDGTTNVTASALVVSNAIGADPVTVVSGSAGLAGANVGTNAITSLDTLTLGGPAAANYTLSGASGTVRTTPLPVTLTGTRPYDGTADVAASLLSVETNYSGTNLNLTGSATLQGSGAGAEGIADFSGLTLSGSAAANYTLDGASGAVTVTPLALTITLSNMSKTYGQAINLKPTAFGVIGGLLDSQKVTSVNIVSAGTPATAPVSGSPYLITAAGASGSGGFEAGNYQITYNPGELTVHHLKVVLAGKRNYDATTNVASSVLVVSNAVGADRVNLVSGRGGLAGAEMGTNAITSLDTLALGGAAAANYTLSGAGGSILIDPLPVSLSGTRPYDGTADVAASLLNIAINYDGTNLSVIGSAVLQTNIVGAENIFDFSSLTLTGAAATNYTLAGASGTVTVAPLAVSLAGMRDYDGSTNAAASILVVSNAVGADQVKVISGSAGLAGANVGTNAITSPGALTLGGPSAANYTVNGATGSVLINPLPVSLNGTRPYDGTDLVEASMLSVETNYSGTNLSLTGSATLQGSGAGLEGIADFSGLSLGGSAAANYTLDGASGTVTVAPLPLTITLSNVSKTYGQAINLKPTAFSVSGGLLDSQKVTSVNIVSAGTPATAPVSGSPYLITAAGASGTGGFEPGNYQITYNPGELTVHHLKVVLTGKRNYDATTNAPAVALVVSNAVGSDQVDLVSGRGGLAGADVGTNAITSLGTLALGGAAAGNYTLSGAGGAVLIDPLPVSLSGTRPYDGTFAVDASLLTIETNHDGTNLSLSGSAILETNLARAESIADFSGLTLSGLAATNYTLDGASGTVLVTPLAVALVGTRDYDGTANAAAAILVVSNLVETDQVSVASGNAVLTGADVGTNAITAPGTLALGGPAAINYTLNGASGAVLVMPLPVTLGGTRPYDGTAEVDASLLSVETNYDGTNLSLSGSATLQGADAGSESIADLSGLSLGGSAATNYTLGGASGTVLITPLALTITLSNASKTYGQTLSLKPTAFAVTGGLLGRENVTSVEVVSAGTPATASVSGSPYAITAESASGIGGFQSGNYQITYNPGALTVNPLQAVLTGTRDYNATSNAAASILVVSNAVGSDEVDLVLGSVELAGADVGTNVITSLATIALGGPAAGNYTLSGAGGAVVIDPLPVSLSGTRPYDGTAEVDASLLSIETNYDGTNLSLSGSATLQGTGAGAENIADFSGLSLSGAAATNYTLDGANGTIAVTPLALTITLSNASKTYGQTLTLKATGFSVGGGLLGSEMVTSVDLVSAGTVANAPVSGSPYLITAAGASGTGGFEDGNYQITYNPGKLTVHHLKAVLGGKRNYDATTNAAASVLVVSNAVGGDQVNFVAGPAGLAGADIGTNAITSLGTIALAGPAAGNYTLSGAGGAVLIDALPVSLSGTRPYDGTELVDVTLLSIETNYDGTNLSLSGGSAILESDAVGPENIADFTGLVLGGLAATNYTLVGANGVVILTNPHIPFAATSVETTGTNAVMCWQSVPGVVYELVTTTNLNPPIVWEVTGDPITATDTNTCVELPPSISTNTITFILIREN